MVIPKSQKDNYKSGSSSVQGTYIIKEDSIDLVCSRDFNTVKKTEIIKNKEKLKNEEGKTFVKEF